MEVGKHPLGVRRNGKLNYVKVSPLFFPLVTQRRDFSKNQDLINFLHCTIIDKNEVEKVPRACLYTAIPALKSGIIMAKPTQPLTSILLCANNFHSVAMRCDYGYEKKTIKGGLKRNLPLVCGCEL